MPEPMTLFLAILFGSIGLGFFLYGKKQGRPIPLICGIVLMVYPYFVSNHIAVVGIGVGVIVISYLFRR